MNNASLLILIMLAKAILLPFILSLVLQLVVRRLGKKSSIDNSNHHLSTQHLVGLSTVVAASFLAAFFAIHQALKIPPAQVLDGIFILAILGWGYGVLVTCKAFSFWVRACLQLVIIIIGQYLLMKPLLVQWTLFDSISQLTLTLLLWFFVWNALEQLAEKEGQVLINTTLLALPCGAAPVIALGGTVLIGQITAALAASIAAFWLIGLWCNDKALLKGMVPVMVSPFMGLLIVAYHYADVNLMALLLILSMSVFAQFFYRIVSQKNSHNNIGVFPLSLIFIIPFSVSIWLVWPKAPLY